MRQIRRVLAVAVALGCAAGALLGGTAAADPVGPQMGFAGSAGAGPGNKLFGNATGFTPGATVTATIRTPGRTWPLATLTASATGAVGLPFGSSHVPLDMPVGNPLLVFTEDATGTVVGGSFPVEAPTLEAYPVLRPGDTYSSVSLRGFAEGDGVETALLLDDEPVTTWSFRDEPWNSFNDPEIRFTTPASTTVGTHTLTVRQTGPRPAAASAQVSVDPLRFTAPPFAIPRGTVTVHLQTTGSNLVYDVTTVDAAGARRTTTTTSTLDRYLGVLAQVQLDGLAPGPATMTLVDRRNGASATVGFTVEGPVVRAPDTLTAGRRVVLADGVTSLYLQTDGDLALRVPGGVAWDTRTTAHPGARLVVQNDGNVVLYDGSTAIWNTGTAGIGAGASFGVDPATGADAAVWTSSGRRAWSSFSSGTGRLLTAIRADQVVFKGQSLPHTLTRGGTVSLVVGADGNVAVNATGRGTLWSTHTQGHPNAYLLLQGNGELVVRAPDGTRLWGNGARVAGARIVAQSDGNIVEYAPNGTAVWSTRTVVR